MNKLGNMILHQVGGVVSQEERIFLLQTCALDLYGVEFCGETKKKLSNDVAKSYHWLIKRALRRSKFTGNHEVCFESGLLTWELLVNWKVFSLWEKIINSENGILKLLWGDDKGDTVLGKRVGEILMQYGREVDTAKDLKTNLKLFVEAMVALKDGEHDEGESEENEM